MAESSWPTTAGVHVVDDVQYEVLAVMWSCDGILGYPGDTSVVYADSSGRQVKIRAEKRGTVRGRGWYSGTSDVTKAIAANSSGSTRVDLVVLRLTRSTWATTVEIVLGTPGAGAPALTQNATGSSSGVWEIPLATVTVANGAATLAAGTVADVTWYAWGQTVTTLSANAYQPSATSHTSLRHSDTGNVFAPISAAWRVVGPWRATHTLGSAAASLTINNIPTYLRHVRAQYTARGDGTATGNFRFRINNDSGANYSRQEFNSYSPTSSVSYAFFGDNTAFLGLLPVSANTGTWGAGIVDAIGWDAPHATELSGVAHHGWVFNNTGGTANAISAWRYNGSSASGYSRIDMVCDGGNFITGSQLTVTGWF